MIYLNGPQPVGHALQRSPMVACSVVNDVALHPLPMHDGLYMSAPKLKQIGWLVFSRSAGLKQSAQVRCDHPTPKTGESHQ